MKLQIKGINDGILISLPEGTWEECCSSVCDTVLEKQNFFKGANLFLEAGTRTIRVVEMADLREELARQEMTLKGVFGGSEKTIQNAKSLGLLTSPVAAPVRTRKRVSETVVPEKHDGGEEAFLMCRNVRSGMIIDQKQTVVVMGDVNPGAEVTSAKNVIVWGRIRGKVCAGLPGGTPALIHALGMDDAQITINGVSAFFEKKKKSKEKQRALTMLNQDGEIIVKTE